MRENLFLEKAEHDSGERKAEEGRVTVTNICGYIWWEVSEMTSGEVQQMLEGLTYFPSNWKSAMHRDDLCLANQQ